jgi:hypothetical protein
VLQAWRLVMLGVCALVAAACAPAASTSAPPSSTPAASSATPAPKAAIGEVTAGAAIGSASAAPAGWMPPAKITPVNPVPGMFKSVGDAPPQPAAKVRVFLPRDAVVTILRG